MKEKKIILLNGSREEASKAFDAAKATITDFKKETVVIRGDIRNLKEGWSVFKTTK